ncbi:MAG: ribonuclease HII [Ktedonobacterales bacterium]
MADGEQSKQDGQPAQLTLLDGDVIPMSRRCGLDEVGRGALAGPLVAAAVVLPENVVELLGPLARFLRDSKTVPRARRVELAQRLRAMALAVELIEMSVEVIDVKGIGWANREAFRRLIARLDADEYVVDGKVRPPAPAERSARVRCMVRADAQVPAVSAASLIAKVHRDTLMATLHEQYPAFGWNENAGYGTPIHLAALRAQGPSPLHRRLFVATVLSGGQRARRTAPATATLPLGEL